MGKVLGQGGNGITYLGAQLNTRSTVAIKEHFPKDAHRRGTTVVPPPTQKAEEHRDAQARFLQEAATLKQFDHPGIVKVYDSFHDNATAYMVMEYVRGQTLAHLIEQADGPLPVDQVLQIVTALADALALIHKHNVLHRDIKPQNIIIAPERGPVLIDFGTARKFVRGKTVRHTRELTLGYAPLEQYGESGRRGPYTDLHALAATIYHALSGREPPDAGARVSGTALAPLRQLNAGVPEAVERAVARAMEIQIDRRPQTVDEFIRDLHGHTGSGLGVLSRMRGLFSSILGRKDAPVMPPEVQTIQPKPVPLPPKLTIPKAPPPTQRGSIPNGPPPTPQATRPKPVTRPTPSPGEGRITITPSAAAVGTTLYIHLAARRGATPSQFASVSVTVHYPDRVVTLPEITTDAYGAASTSLVARYSLMPQAVPVEARVRDESGSFVLKSAFAVLVPKHTPTPAPPGAPKPTVPTARAIVVASRLRQKYHRPDCEWARKIWPDHRVSFKSPAEARARGLRPCHACHPG